MWTTQQLQYLADNAGLKNHRQLSEHLGKSVAAIKLKQTRNGIRFLDNFYSYSALARELGRSRRILRKWVNRGWLKCRRASWKTYYGTTPMIFQEEDIVTFLKTAPHILRPEQIPNPYFANVLRSKQ